MHCDTKHIIFLQAAHTATDERVCYHQAQALRDLGHVVDVYGMDSFRSFEPQVADVYIVDTPIALWKIRRVSAKIIYDVTEWYPSKKNLRNARFSKLVKAIVLMMASVWASYRCSAFIFGEYDKAKPFRFLFPRKKHIFLPYYPDLNYIRPIAVNDITQVCRVLYAGALTEEKGWGRVLDTMQKAAQQMPQTHFCLDVITKDACSDLPVCDNLTIRQLEYMPFPQFCEQITKYDIFLDLRDIDFENTRCLPIKLFYYMACGRPSIYANLSAISKGVSEISQCARLVNNAEEATDALCGYVCNRELYQSHCSNALHSSIDKYNWNRIKSSFVQLIYEV